MIITGKEKAFLGGLGAGISTFAGQLSTGGKIDVKTVAWSLGAWVATHLFVYYTTNTQVAQSFTEDASTLGAAVAAAEKPVAPVAPGTTATPAEQTPPAAPAP